MEKRDFMTHRRHAGESQRQGQGYRVKLRDFTQPSVASDTLREALHTPNFSGLPTVFLP
jgi:hypothetical protein